MAIIYVGLPPSAEVDLCGHATLASVHILPELLRALGTTSKYVGKNLFDYLVEVESEEVF